jgi:hypothetical protein
VVEKGTWYWRVQAGVTDVSDQLDFSLLVFVEHGYCSLLMYRPTSY